MKNRRLRTGLGALTAMGFIALGCGTKPASDQGPGDTISATVAPEKAAASASAALPETPVVAPDKAAIVGRVLYDGTPPKPKPVNFGPEKQCAAMHEKPPVYETLVVNPNGTLRWVLVSIKGRVSGDHTVPSEPVVLDQVGCVFVPHVVAVMQGQSVEFRNSDPLMHNVRGLPKLGTPFNQIFTSQSSQTLKMDTAEIGVPIKCDVHFWMSAYVHVLRHPFFAVTGGDGTFTINGVPPGTYTLTAWHESLKEQAQEVAIEAGQATQVEFVFSES